eukprot:6187318-Pleurochrysis_carterae.AAC.1
MKRPSHCIFPASGGQASQCVDICTPNGVIGTSAGQISVSITVGQAEQITHPLRAKRQDCHGWELLGGGIFLHEGNWRPHPAVTCATAASRFVKPIKRALFCKVYSIAGRPSCNHSIDCKQMHAVQMSTNAPCLARTEPNSGH